MAERHLKPRLKHNLDSAGPGPNAYNGLWSSSSKCHGFQTKLKLKYLQEQWQNVEIREKQGRPKTSITSQGDNIILRSSQCLTNCALSLGLEQRQASLAPFQMFRLLTFLLVMKSFAPIALCIVIFISLVNLYSLRHVVCYGSQRIFMWTRCWANMMKIVCLCYVELKPSPIFGKLFSQWEFAGFQKDVVYIQPLFLVYPFLRRIHSWGPNSWQPSVERRKAGVWCVLM